MALVADRLSFGYSSVRVLDGLSFGPLARGEITVLVGPNGSGKSTLFRCLSGVARPRAGSATLDGAGIDRIAPKERARKIFHLCQELPARIALTVFETVLLARKSLAAGFSIQSSAADLAAVEAALVDLELVALAGRPLGSLSGGQRQLVGIAQALVRDPDVLLLDEPTSALDIRRQLEVMETVRRVTSARHIVTLAAMHDLSLAARFADRLLLLNGGKIVAEGSPEEVLRSAGTAETYGVVIEVERSRRGSLMVDSHLLAPQIKLPMRSAE